MHGEGNGKSGRGKITPVERDASEGKSYGRAEKLKERVFASPAFSSVFARRLKTSTKKYYVRCFQRRYPAPPAVTNVFSLFP